MKVIISILCFSFLPYAYSSQHKLPWDGPISHPDIMGTNFITNLDYLPLSGEYSVPKRLWSGYYWPFYKGGIDERWFAKNQAQRNASPPSRKEAMESTIYFLSALSPAEKYDLFIGRYDYPLKNWSRSLIPRNVQSWEGVCHGWSPASINHDEPRPRILKNPDGVEIPFSSADIKALLSFYYAFGFEVDNTHQMGKRCEASRKRNHQNECQDDLNAGAFHIALTNQVGLLNQSFVIDTQPLREVWNNPVHSYSSNIVQTLNPLRDSSPHTIKVVRVKTKVIFVESIRPNWQTTLQTNLQSYKDNFYEYYLDIDSSNHIIGGKWISNDRPDFIWKKRRPARFAGLLSEMGRLLLE